MMLRLLIFLVMSMGVVTGVTAQDSKPEKYKSGDDDGFTRSGINFAVSVYGQEEVCTESVMTMGVVVQGMESYTYQWFKDGNPITGAKGAEYEIADVQLGDAGTYYCEVTDFAGRSTVASSGLKLKVSISPKITLKASKTKIASGDSCLLWVTGEPGTTYQWSTLQSKDSIWVKPGQNTRYYVVGKNGNICDITKYVDIEVVDLYVKPSLDQYITKSGVVRLTAQSNVTDIKWYAKPIAMSAVALKALASGENYGELVGEGASIEVTPSVSTLYTAVASMNGYSVNRSTAVHIKGAQSFVGGMDAGFSRTGVNFSVNVSVTPNPVCENARSVFKASVNGVEGYKYAWFKLQDGQPDLLMAETDSFFFNKTALSDSGDYFCRISDLVEKDTLVSGILHLNVNPLPVASIVPDGDTTICLSDTLLLKGYSSVAGAGFSWRGNSAVDPLNSQNIRVVPTDSARYILTTSLNGCATNDTVDVAVNRALVNVPYSMNATKGNPITITAKNANGNLISGNSLSWFQDGIKNLGNGNPILISDVEEDMVIRAAFDTGKCTYSDYTHVYVKGRETFNGGVAQGFNRTAVNFNVTVGVTPNPVCEGIGVQFASAVNGLENYTYKWFKLRDGSTDSLVGQQDSFLIPRTSMNDSGFYFCQIVDAMGKDTVVSDTLKLGVLHSVIAEITGSRDTVMCVNDTIELKGTTSLAGTAFTWGGANIVGRWDSAYVQVAPTGKTDYILYPNVTGCAVNDTITVHINKAFVDIPAIVNVGEGGSVELTALDGGGVIGDGSKLNWWRDTTNDLGHGNPKIIPLIMKDMAITVTYDTGTCQFVDYAKIYVKGIDAYRGGVDEGYSRTAVNFKLEVEVNPNPVCENWRSVFYANVIGVEEYSYQWFKLREGQADSLVAQADSFVFEQTALGDSGLYFCKVTDIQGKDTLLSDTLKLAVNPSPVASIVPLADTVICLGDTLLLEGRSTVADVNYSWRGADILDLLTDQNVRVLPRDSAQYILTVNGNGCISADTINVTVNKAAVKVPYSINGVKDKPIVITAKDANDNQVNGSSLTWTRDDVSDLGDGNPKQITLVDQDMVIRVDYDTANCIFEGYTRIYVKDNNTFNGGVDDGFDRTAVNFKVDVKVNPNPVCEAIGALFTAAVTGTDEYTYKWFKLREGTTDSLVSRRDSFMISRTALSDSGYYFCQVSDVMGKDTVLSDTLQLKVASSVIASILGGRDTSICVNDTLVLEGVVSLNGAALVWSGSNIIGRWDSSIVVVAPTEKTDYVLATNFAGCSVNDTITVDINRAFVKIPPIINILENAKLEITAEDANGAIQDGGKLTWWRDTVNNLGHGNPKEITSDRDMVITVVYDTATCVFTDESRIYVRGLDAFAGGDDDGFDRSIINFDVKVEANPNPVCENMASVIYATVNGPEEYQYVWFKLRDGQSDSLINRSDSIWFEKATLADSGFYFCQIQDVHGKIALNSDTVHFVVHAIPVATIKPQGDTLICMSDTLTLQASSDIAGVAYSWMGNDILDSLTSQNIRVAPSDTADYVLRVDNHGCVATDTLRVYINRASVRLPYSVNAIKGGDVVLTAKDENNNPLQGSRLTWTRDDVSDLGDGNPMSVLAVDRDMIIMVAYDTAKCIYRDYTHIYVKDDNTFNGGIDDGFDRTAVNFKVDVTVDPNPVCEKMGSVFAAAVTGLEGYDFKWFKLREGLTDSLMAEKDTFMIPRTELSDSGFYFCQVTDAMGKDTVISDTLKLKVVSSVYATISGNRDTSICVNDTLILEGKASISGTELVWSGSNIIGRWDSSIVVVAPTEKTDYVLATNFAGCSVNDTITVDINRAFVKIPPIINILENAKLEITAEDANGTIKDGEKLTWWRDTVNNLGHGNPKEITSDRDMVITVVYDTATCVFTDESRIYVRGLDAFAGGDDDGFDRSIINFDIKVEANPNPVCENMASVIYATVNGPEEYQYVWFKLRDGQSDSLINRSDSIWFEKATLADSGFYFCQIQDVHGKIALNSDTVHFVVHAIPVATIKPQGDTLICMSDTLTLHGGSDIAGVAYSWMGNDILDSLTSQNIRVAPSDTADYVLRVDNHGCVATDTVRVYINRASVHLPYSINAIKGSDVVLTAKDENNNPLQGSSLTWTRDDVSDLGDGNPMSVLAVDRDMIIMVAYDTAKCVYRDYTHIYVKDDNTFNGGIDDGFDRTAVNFKVDVTVDPNPVCEKMGSVFAAAVTGLEGYDFKWFKLREGLTDSLMAEKDTFMIPRTELSDSGFYFCQVTDAMGKDTVISDTLKLKVIPSVYATILGSRDTIVCLNDTVTLEGFASEAGTELIWSGSNIIGRWDTNIIQIAPTEKTDYVLTTIYAGCAVNDTITVDVNRAIVKIPPVIYTLKDAELEITAKDENGIITNGDKLTWWRDTVNNLGHGNPKKIVPVDTDMLITVVYDTATCPLVAYSNVYIRNGSGVFDGGYDDGFARNAITFGLEVLAQPNPVCEDMASVLIAKTSGLEEYTYQWFKIRDGRADTMIIAKDSLVFDKTELADSGYYYCQITEERSKERVNSDTIYFDVRAKVIASILPDVDVDTVRCMNDTLILEGVSSIDGAVFSWRGEEILDSLTSQNIRIVPVERTTYILTVNNDGCAANDTIVVDVNKSFVKVPYSINAVAGSSVEITAVDENGDVITDIDKLTWWRDTIIPLVSANPQIINPADRNMIVRVEYENRGCITFDDTRIYVKDSASYNGGEDDGFAGSVINFGVDIEIEPDTVCEGGEVEFIASVNGESDYTYKWWKINNPDSLMSDSSYFKIEHTVLRDSGLYFCAVTDKNGNATLHSDTLRLVVHHPLIANIIIPDGRDTSVNEGASLIVEASVNAEVDTMVWFISKQDGTLERKPLTGELTLNNIDVTYDSCSVWFEVSNSCGTASSDTVMIWVGLQLRVSPSVSFICPEDSAMIVVELLKGANPWTYHYRAPSAMTDSIVTNIAGQTDTLYVKQKGTYRITYVEDADGVTRTKNLPEFKVNVFNTTVKFSGGGEICRGDSDTVLIEVKNGVGPWSIEIRTVSENELAYALMGGNASLQISDSIVKIGFTPFKSEGYYISLIEDLHHDEFICLGTPDKDTVTIKVNNPGKVILKGDNIRYGQCNDINIRTTLRPRLDGVICKGGNFNLDGEWMATSEWKTEDLTAGTHKIMFQDTVGGCKVKSDTIDLYVDTLSAALSLDHFHCKNSGVVDSLLVEVSGMGSFSFDLTQVRIGKNGPYMTQTNGKTIPSLDDTVVTLNYMEAIGWMDSDVAVVYRVTNVTDGYGCPWAIDKLLDTIIAMPKPTLKIESRTPDENTAPWKVQGDDDFYNIPKGQLVGVKATLTGTPQWKLLIDRNNQPYSSIAGITGQDTTFTLNKSGEYKFRVANDKYCSNYDDPKYVGVSYLDTGYIRLKAMLEGPFSSAAGNRMVSGIPASSIPLYGIPHLPVVPGKKVIDWIEVELRTGSPIDSVARMGEGAVLFVKDTCLLLDDGTVVDRWGSDTIALRYAYGEESKVRHYYVVLRHRNHLSVMTKKEFKVTNKRSESELVDFRDSMNLYHSQNTKLEDHMKYVTDGRKEIWMMCAGEVNDNKLISIYDPNSVTTHNNGLKGYYLEDVNFDGEIDLTRGFGGAMDGKDWRIVKKNRNRYTEILFKQVVPTK